MHRSATSIFLTVTLSGTFILAGCLGNGTAGPAPLTVLAEQYNADGDPRSEVLLDLYFTRGGQEGVRVDASGQLNLARAEGDVRQTKVEYEPIGAVRVEINKDDRNWVETEEHGDLYRQVMNDHHFEEGASYLITIDLRDGDKRYASKVSIFYGEDSDAV